jgi:hypothetical protein
METQTGSGDLPHPSFLSLESLQHSRFSSRTFFPSVLLVSQPFLNRNNVSLWLVPFPPILCHPVLAPAEFLCLWMASSIVYVRIPYPPHWSA